MRLETKYNIGDKIWVVYLDRGEVSVFDDIIKEINILEDGIEYWCDKARDAIKENEIVKYEDEIGLVNKIKELLEVEKEQ